ncbi:MAG TPA: helix-turn-helix domain-containing protein [Thermodesulfobacteriota bacterium]|nr:helix-turn-helix domain-containing protein [Thermodesulfobacteriota bacterium]
MGVKYSDVIERMKSSANLKNDSRVAKALGVTPQAISNYKKRGSLPSDLVLKFAAIYNVSVDWLITGEGAARKSAREGDSAKEETASYGAAYGKALAGLADFAALSPEEIIYVGKLLKILREADKSTVSVLKWSVDAFLKAAESGKEEPKKEEPKKEEKS